ncbi:MAG: hypothetical protein ABIP54_00790, partial [Candidatus Andersenbacteria bacterium]
VRSFRPLIAPLRPLPKYGNYIYEYPDNMAGEGPECGYANVLSSLSGQRRIMTNVGETAHSMDYIKKGGIGKAYQSFLDELVVNKALAAAQGWNSFIVSAVNLIHGEANCNDPAYKAQVVQFLIDLNTDVKAITGQSEDIIMLLSQQCALNATTLGRTISTVMCQELAAEQPTKFYVAPRYQMFNVDQDGPAHYRYHFDGVANRRNGELMGKVKDRGDRGLKTTLKPLSATQSGAVIRIEFEVPVPPLQWANTLPAVHPLVAEWINASGFEVEDNAGLITINSVRILGKAVEITCNSTPGAGGRVSYAMYQDAINYNTSIDLGRHGFLCDSDNFTSYSAQSIVCNVTNGSAIITCVTPGDFADRGQFELVSGSGLLSNSHVTLKPDGDSIILGHDWTGSTGTATLFFKNDHRNYSIQFTLTL